MLEKPDIPDQHIIARLKEAYGLETRQLAFLPLGADVNTAVYRVVAHDGTAYFLKLRKNTFDEINVAVPQFLADNGLREIIAPVKARSGKAWANFDPYAMILYPYIAGSNGYQTALTDRQWIAFGAALRTVHAAQLPAELASRIPRENYSAFWRDRVTAYLEQVESTTYTDPVAVKVAALMRDQRDVIQHLIRRAEQLARDLETRNLAFVLCHSDIHAGNLLIASDPTAQDSGLYIVDWDAPIFAPKERDLMFIGWSKVWGGAREAALFYEAYTHSHQPADFDQPALAYYRYERIIEDIAAFCDQLLASSAGGEDREQSLEYLTSNFLPGGEIELARHVDPDFTG